MVAVAVDQHPTDHRWAPFRRTDPLGEVKHVHAREAVGGRDLGRIRPEDLPAVHGTSRERVLILGDAVGHEDIWTRRVPDRDHRDANLDEGRPSVPETLGHTRPALCETQAAGLPEHLVSAGCHEEGVRRITK